MPSKRKVTGRKNNSLDLKKREKHQAFLKDFDLEGIIVHNNHI